MRIGNLKRVIAMVALACAIPACSENANTSRADASTSKGGSAAGGTPVGGGAVASGGGARAGGAGGVSQTGGSTGSGGTLGLGGGAATGGVAGLGGSGATGGTTGRGGNAATGGVAGLGGNAATGGTVGRGGSVATGGVAGLGGAGATGGADASAPDTRPVDAATPDGGTSSNEVAYVMVYFTESPNYSEARYALHLAYSYDGLHYVPLNQNNPVATPTTGEMGLRDPFLLKKRDGNYVVVATNMKGINMAGNRSKFLHVWESNDGLQTISNYRQLQVHTMDTSHAWAPEAFWDEAKGKYAVVWAGNTDRNRLYVSYTTDFKTVDSTTTLTVFHDPGYDIYDGDMLIYKGTYYFYNANGRIYGWKSASSTPKSFTQYVPALSPTGAAIEAPTLVQKEGADVFWLWGDSYSPVNALFYVWQSTDITTNSWKQLDRREYEGPPNGKHNSICKVTRQEVDKMIAKWGNPAWQRIKSYSKPDNFIRHTNNVGRVDISVVDPIIDSKWKVVPGLADPAGVSFESVGKPNSFLRHSNDALALGAKEDTAAFKDSATFHKVPGLANPAWTSFRAHTDANKYIRHKSNLLRIEAIATDADKQDATFKIFYEAN